MVSVAILDGYVDEPTCLGVPPYISPYPRYLAGSVYAFDAHATVQYVTIDQLRMQPALGNKLSASDVLVVIAGMHVPGRYLSGYPVSPGELQRFLPRISGPVKVLAGPAAQRGFGLAGGKRSVDTSTLSHLFDVITVGDGEAVLPEVLSRLPMIDSVDSSRCRTQDMLHDSAVKGASVVSQHPFFPSYLIAEIETYRGCARSIRGGCSFCSEPLKGSPQFRPIQDILDEVSALYLQRVRHFRLGNQPCLFSYLAHDAQKKEFPRPNPEALEQLFSGIRQVAPDLKTLHIDNANPKILSLYPEECTRIAQTILTYHTSGDVAAFGVESVDPKVIKANNLKANQQEVFDAIRLLNHVGRKRGSNGLPELLPGLNFVFGLQGETRKTFDLNLQFLKQIRKQNLLVRRINLRQVMPLPGTPMSRFGEKNIRKHKASFKQFKRTVREIIDRPLLKRLIPETTVLTNVFTELYRGKTTFGRQIGSYPLLIGIPGILPLHQFINVKVIGYGYRSLTAVPYPLDINTTSQETLTALPGIGKKRALRILRSRPYESTQQLLQTLDDPTVAQTLMEYIN